MKSTFITYIFSTSYKAFKRCRHREVLLSSYTDQRIISIESSRRKTCSEKKRSWSLSLRNAMYVCMHPAHTLHWDTKGSGSLIIKIRSSWPSLAFPSLLNMDPFIITPLTYWPHWLGRQHGRIPSSSHFTRQTLWETKEMPAFGK